MSRDLRKLLDQIGLENILLRRAYTRRQPGPRDSQAGPVLGKAAVERSFDAEKLRENVLAFLQDLSSAKPSSVKGQFVRTMTLSSTVGPGIGLDEKAIFNELRKGG